MYRLGLSLIVISRISKFFIKNGNKNSLNDYNGCLLFIIILNYLFSSKVHSLISSYFKLQLISKFVSGGPLNYNTLSGEGFSRFNLEKSASFAGTRWLGIRSNWLVYLVLLGLGQVWGIWHKDRTRVRLNSIPKIIRWAVHHFRISWLPSKKWSWQGGYWSSEWVGSSV